LGKVQNAFQLDVQHKVAAVVSLHRHRLDIECSKPLLYTHVGQRVFEPCSTVATHSIGFSVDGEHAAQMAVMATKYEVEGGY
jgi:hypothetical protein